MVQSRILELVDRQDFQTLFVHELGWSLPDRKPLIIPVDGHNYTLTQVGGFRALRVWWCNELPAASAQRAIDDHIARLALERLIIFATPEEQEWRWPRRAQPGGSSAALIVHKYRAGVSDEDMRSKLEAIRIGLDEEPTLLEVLARVRSVFSKAAEDNAKRAAHLMEDLYEELHCLGLSEHTATRLLARLLFLMFADDTNIWPRDQFLNFMETHTSAETLANDLGQLFRALNLAEGASGRPQEKAYATFSYVNGGLFADQLELPTLSAKFRDSVIRACAFNWSAISPAVFGAMFQQVRDETARRGGGEHYTTEENILKTLGPLFLDELYERLDRAQELSTPAAQKKALTDLHRDLERIRILDPACGCGNFLVVAYRELRALELLLLRRRRDLDLLDNNFSTSQATLVAEDQSRVRLSSFYGIEVDEWPASIAGTAMLLMRHKANLDMQDAGLGGLLPAIPIAEAPTITVGNATRLDWRDVFVEPSSDAIVVGNPPFVGRRYRTATQTADMNRVWGRAYNVNLDYVTTWYVKALQYFGQADGRWAFVSTNSICQGDPVARLFDPILRAGWRIRFAHRSFRWTSDATNPAGVHVSVIGFDRKKGLARLYAYARPDDPPKKADVGNISPYLLPGDNTLVWSRSDPLTILPPIVNGNMPRCKALVVQQDAYEEATRDAVAARYLRRYVGTDELLKNLPRWCLWLVDATEAEMRSSEFIQRRLAECRDERLASEAADTREYADFPHLFAQRPQPAGPILIIPKVTSESREYVTAAYSDGSDIVSDLVFCGPDPDGFGFAVVSSAMFMAWMRGIGGRHESRTRFSKTLTYNNFPMPRVSRTDRATVARAGRLVLAAREKHRDQTLVQLYGSGGLPEDLRVAHEELDTIVDGIFASVDSSESGRLTNLLKHYARLTQTGSR